MPTEAYHVRQVFSSPTRNGLTRYEIELIACAADVHDTIVSTLSWWAASLCERAKDQHARVSVGWKDSRFGPELVTCVLLTNPPMTEAQAVCAAEAK